MKKTILTIAALLLSAAIAQAAKTSTVFYPGVEGYLPNPNVSYNVYEEIYTNEFSEVYNWVVVLFYGMTSKDTLVFTKLAVEKPGYELAIVMYCPAKAVIYKGKTPGRVGGFYSHRPIPLIKMNKVTFATVSCNELKKLQCADIQNIYHERLYDKGTVVKASGRVGYKGFFPQDAEHYGRVWGYFKSISAGDFGEIFSDVSTPKTLVLKARKPSEGVFHIFPGVNYKAKNVKVDTFDLPKEWEYAKVDLENGNVWLGCEAPETWEDIDKSRYMWLRRIRVGTFTMGSPVGEPCRGGNENEHQVTLTRDFYAGVFELTKAQLKYITGSGEDSLFPASGLTYDDLRGSNEGAKFPASTSVDADSIIGKLRSLTECDFDLPTEAQWEYVCKSGTHGTWNDGSAINIEEVDGKYKDANLDSLGWYDAAIHQVGLLEPNLWGLYDMHGNVPEMCLDWYKDELKGPVTDPVGPASGQKRVVRGFGLKSPIPATCRSAYRDSVAPEEQFSGARIVISW